MDSPDTHDVANSTEARSTRRLLRWLGAALVVGVLFLWLAGGVPWLRSPLDFSGISWNSRQGGPVKSGSVVAGPIRVDTAPELTARGITATYFGTSVHGTTGLFYNFEDRRVLVLVTGHEGDPLGYTIYDAQGAELASGRLVGGVAAGQYEIRDAILKDAARILIQP